MDAAERIADYLSDDLAPDERAAFEAELAGDAALQARLEAVRRADDALAGVPAIELPDGFTDRLRAALDAELADVLTPTGADLGDSRVAAQAELARHDELAARRAERQAPRWAAWTGAAAAAVLVVVAGVAGLGSLGAGDEAADMASPQGLEAETEETAEADAGAQGGADTLMEAPEAADGDDEVEMESAEETEESGAGEAADEDSADARFRASQTAPTVFADGRSLDEDQLDQVLAAFELEDLAGVHLSETDGGQLAARWRDILSAPDGGDGATEDGDGAREVGAVSAADREAVAECVVSLLDGRDDAIPAYAELADFDGRPAVVLGLVTLDPATATFSRTEAHALDRDGCAPLASAP